MIGPDFTHDANETINRKPLTNPLRHPRVIQVIVSEGYRGDGTAESPLRTVKYFHTLDGEFLTENDPMPGTPM